MSKFIVVLKIAGVIAGVVGVGGLIGWLGSRPPAMDSQCPAPPPVSAPARQDSTPEEAPPPMIRHGGSQPLASNRDYPLWPSA